ncbi:MAG: Uma2 family endonuclease [Microcystaceae cyanobacterium]
MAEIQAKRFTLDEYHRLTEIGFFQEEERLELIAGEIIQMAAKGTAHETCLRRLWKQLFPLVGQRATLQSQSPIIIPPNSEPEPDFAIVKNRADDYFSSHPTPVDVLLLIEVADSSLDYDQNVKLPLYAQAGITDYWIFNLLDNWLEIYSEPHRINQGKAGYSLKRIILPNQQIVLPCFPDSSLDLSKTFPHKDNDR